MSVYTCGVKGCPIQPMGGGYPIQPTGGTPSQVQWGGGYHIQLSGGTPSQVWEGYPIQSWPEGTPSQVQVRGILGYPQPGMDGVPPSQNWMGYPTPCQEWMGSPQPGLDGVPPGQNWMGYPPIRQSIASTCYAAGGMPLAFTQEDFLVLLNYFANDPRQITHATEFGKSLKSVSLFNDRM